MPQITHLNRFIMFKLDTQLKTIIFVMCTKFHVSKLIFLLITGKSLESETLRDFVTLTKSRRHSMAANTYLYSTNFLEIWCMIYVPNSKKIEFELFKLQSNKINERLYIRNADPRTEPKFVLASVKFINPILACRRHVMACL